MPLAQSHQGEKGMSVKQSNESFAAVYIKILTKKAALNAFLMPLHPSVSPGRRHHSPCLKDL